MGRNLDSLSSFYKIKLDTDYLRPFGFLRLAIIVIFISFFDPNCSKH